MFGSVDSSELGTRFVQRAGRGNAALGRGRLLLAGGRREVARQRVGVRGRQAERLVVAGQHVGQHRGGGRRRSLCWMDGGGSRHRVTCPPGANRATPALDPATSAKIHNNNMP